MNHTCSAGLCVLLVFIINVLVVQLDNCSQWFIVNDGAIMNMFVLGKSTWFCINWMYSLEDCFTVDKQPLITVYGNIRLLMF